MNIYMYVFVTGIVFVSLCVMATVLVDRWLRKRVGVGFKEIVWLGKEFKELDIGDGDEIFNVEEK